jgi:hypothetical protein
MNLEKIDRKIKIILLISLISLLTISELLAAEKGGVSLNAETLSAGAVHKEATYLPRALEIACVLRTPIDTRMSKEGDLITVQVSEDILLGEYSVIPANSFLHGYIKHLKGPGKFHRAPEVDISFSSLSMPGDGGSRRYMPIQGRIHHKAVLTSAERVSDTGATFKKRMLVPAAAGAATFGAGTWWATTSWSPFATFGIESILNNLLIGSSMVGGAMLATSLIDKDDIRIEAGTDLKVLLEGITVEAFQQDYPMPQNLLKDLTPIDVYDRYDEMRSLPLEKKSSRKNESSDKTINKYLSAM